MRVRVLAFARVAEILGWTRSEIELSAGSGTDDLWQRLVTAAPALAPLADSTRIARNGRVVMKAEPLAQDDEIALLPPAGGG
ncbi:MAG TPA: MoaD/ThiS family protein [Candidatus Baltobacteraceae bacterium]|nr:MoaD/ThiS family protein [Candidatus Baltobacteraceae bacterium]